MTKPPSKVSSGGIPSLDGLRAVSILLVVLAHARGTRGYPGWVLENDHGYLGVQVFFVISGFLITTLLLEEEKTYRTISLKLFYARRTIRIFPPFYLFLVVMAGLDWAGIFTLPKYNLLFAATYTMNYNIKYTVWFTAHLWSLAVEEQFYLTWPLLIKLFGSARAIRAALVLALGAPLALFVLYLMVPTATATVGLFFPFVADSIAAGCVLAGAMPWLRKQAWFQAALTASYGWLAVVLIALLAVMRGHPRFHFLIGEPLLNLSICYVLARYTEYPETLGGRLLNLPAVAWIGKLSYSIYLWQQLFMNPVTGSFLQSFPANMGFALACAVASYYTVERPLAGLRKRMRPAPPAPSRRGPPPDAPAAS